MSEASRGKAGDELHLDMGRHQSLLVLQAIPGPHLERENVGVNGYDNILLQLTSTILTLAGMDVWLSILTEECLRLRG